jgi:16S rRNA A1518/A1519 N6-dimethyltransferase RsmA/KsgA/DIM1 with predicted DNA glycosylase/AP lyase activity
LLPYSESTNAQCAHGPLTEEETNRNIWLEKGDAAHTALRKIVLNKRLLNNIPYYINNR